MIWGATWWEAASALGTVGAVVVALLLAAAETARARRAEHALAEERAKQRSAAEERQAEMVSAWVEIRATPSEDGSHYERKATVHIANESDLPVFNAKVSVGVQTALDRWTPVGPLAVPLPLPVLASRSRQSWDITIPLLACSLETSDFTGGPTAAIAFTDSSGERWTREFDRGLTRQTKKGSGALFDIDPENAEEQLGQIDNPFNPITTVLLFLHALRQEDGSDWDLISTLLDPSANGWSEMPDDHWMESANEWSRLGIAAHVYYPAPRIAYVKTLTDEAASQRVDGPGYVQVPITVFTLRFVRGAGWLVFSIGAPTPAHMIEFPENDLFFDIRSPNVPETPSKSTRDSRAGT